MAVYEAGKTWPEADADVSEAIDFCEYYAATWSACLVPSRWFSFPVNRTK